MNFAVDRLSYDEQAALAGTLYSCDPIAVQGTVTPRELRALSAYYLVDLDSSDGMYKAARRLATSRPGVVTDAKTALEKIAVGFAVNIEDT